MCIFFVCLVGTSGQCIREVCEIGELRMSAHCNKLVGLQSVRWIESGKKFGLSVQYSPESTQSVNLCQSKTSVGVRVQTQSWRRTHCHRDRSVRKTCVPSVKRSCSRDTSPSPTAGLDSICTCTVIVGVLRDQMSEKGQQNRHYLEVTELFCSRSHASEVFCLKSSHTKSDIRGETNLW